LNSLIKAIFLSSLGKKIISAITGLGLYLYVILHLAGNLTLFARQPAIFNRYAHFLESLGWLVIAIELVLLLGFLFHVFYGVLVWLEKRRARPDGYLINADIGAPSRKTFSSKNMIWTGILLGAFTIIHVITFKYGPGVDQGYMTIVNGVEMRDLYRLVVETFSNKYYVAWYVIAMLFLGFHLRHAFWSSLQSLGANNAVLTPIFFWLGAILAFLLALGFIVIPIFIYFTGGA
jgi:succinate dehydrogenase / fumarate reductase, cytochrome b subunit